MKEELLKTFEERVAVRYKGASAKQYEIITCGRENLLISAGPGAGKTRVIVNRIDYLVNFLGVNPNHIIVLTFTKAAAVNMKKRYVEMNPRDRAPFFGTFHGLFYKILKAHNEEINIISTVEVYRLLNNFLLNYLDEVSEEKVKEVIHNISRLKTSHYSMEEFTPTLDKEIFAQCFTFYERYKEEKRVMDFDDLQIQTQRLFLKNERILTQYRRAFQYILVDEFQDCDEMQIELLKLLNQGNTLFAVGDEDQCIYGFRGSNPQCMVDFDKNFYRGKTKFLSTNYRSCENIVNMSMELIGKNKIRTEKTVVPFRKAMGECKALSSIDEKNQAEAIGNHIQLNKEMQGRLYKENAILYRTNVESRSIIDSFIRKKIPFRLLDKEYNFFEHFICKDILAYLKLSLDPSDQQAFGRVINKPFRYVSKLVLEKLRKNPVKEDCFEFIKNREETAVFQIKNLEKVRKEVENLNKMSLYGAVHFIISDLGYHSYLLDYCTRYKMSLSEYEDILEEFKGATEGFQNIIAFLAHVEEFGEKIKENDKVTEDAVILSTIHGVKGMEFSQVYLINCNEEYMPHSNGVEENLEEERRLFYVGITRTIHDLWFCICNKIRGKHRETSRFIKECNLQLWKDTVLQYEEGEIVFHQVYGQGKIVAQKEKEIDIQFADKNIRKFDIMILTNCGLLTKV